MITVISLINTFSSVQSLSRLRLFATPWIAACQTSLSITNSRSSLRLTSIKSVMPSSHLILCRPLLLLPPIPPSIKVFSNESTLTPIHSYSIVVSISRTLCCAVLSHSVVSDSLWPQGLQPARLLCPWGFSRQEMSSARVAPNSGIKHRSPALQADSLPSESPGKPKNTRVGSLSLLQGNFPAQGLNQGLLLCRWILYQLSCAGSLKTS